MSHRNFNWQLKRLWQPADTWTAKQEGKNMTGVHTSKNTVHAVSEAESNKFLGQPTIDIVIAFQLANH